LQLQIGEWDITRHWAFIPQTFDSEQGFTHRLSLHALERSHSELLTHSGRQDGGEPVMVGRHEQIACPFVASLHWELGPHGDGLHGFLYTAVLYGEYANV